MFLATGRNSRAEREEVLGSLDQPQGPRCAIGEHEDIGVKKCSGDRAPEQMPSIAAEAYESRRTLRLRVARLLMSGVSRPPLLDDVVGSLPCVECLMSTRTPATPSLRHEAILARLHRREAGKAVDLVP